MNRWVMNVFTTLMLLIAGLCMLGLVMFLVKLVDAAWRM